MSHATSGMPARVVLDWRHGTIGDLAPCVLCGTPAAVPVPGQGRALPQGLRRDLDHQPTPATRADRARLIRAYTPGRGEPR